MSFYAVKNFEGKWFRAKGRDGYGDTWVPDIGKARIYTKLGQAQSRCTFFARLNTKLPAPQVVELRAVQVRVIDQTERITKANQKKAEETARQDAYRKQQRLRDAQAEFDRAAARLQKVQRGE